MAKQPEPVKVKVIEITGTEFKPGSTYLIAFDHAKVDLETMGYVAEELQEQSGAVITAVAVTGDPREAITFFAIPERQENVYLMPPPKPDEDDGAGQLVGRAS